MKSKGSKSCVFDGISSRTSGKKEVSQTSIVIHNKSQTESFPETASSSPPSVSSSCLRNTSQKSNIAMSSASHTYGRSLSRRESPPKVPYSTKSSGIGSSTSSSGHHNNARDASLTGTASLQQPVKTSRHTSSSSLNSALSRFSLRRLLNPANLTRTMTAVGGGSSSSASKASGSPSTRATSSNEAAAESAKVSLFDNYKFLLYALSS